MADSVIPPFCSKRSISVIKAEQKDGTGQLLGNWKRRIQFAIKMAAILVILNSFGIHYCPRQPFWIFF